MKCKYCNVDRLPENFHPENKSKCRPCLAKYQREYHASRDPRERRDERLRRWHNISLEDFEAMAAAQDNLCLVCGEDEPLVVDHDHQCCPTKKSCGSCIRGLLCAACNLTLGQSRESPARLQGLINYLAERK